MLVATGFRAGLDAHAGALRADDVDDAILQRSDDPQSAAVGDAMALRRDHRSGNAVPARRPHPLCESRRLAPISTRCRDGWSWRRATKRLIHSRGSFNET